MILEFWDSDDNLYKTIETDEIEVDDKTIENIKNEAYNQAIEDLVKLVCEYYTMQEKVGYCADTNNMIKQRVTDFAEQLRK